MEVIALAMAFSCLEDIFYYDKTYNYYMVKFLFICKSDLILNTLSVIMNKKDRRNFLWIQR